MAFGIAMVGLDHWYTALGALDIAASSSVVTLVGIAEPDAVRRAHVAQKYPAITAVAEEDALLSRADVDLVAICAPTGKAPELAMRALAAGKHVLSVKPPARTLEELDAVIAAAERVGRFYGSFEGMQRLHPRARALRDLIRSGAIGLPMSFHQVGHGGLPSPWPGQPSGAPSWWLDAELVPGGAWIDHAIYAVDLARFAFEGEVDYAAGIVETRVHTHLALEDYGVSLMRLRPGAGGPSVALIFEDTWTAEPGGGIHRQQIIGTLGSIRPEGGAWIVSRGGEETTHSVEDAPFFPFDALAQGVMAGGPVPFGAADARANLAACLAVYRAAAL